jgi:hypothetical protein
MGGKVHKEHLFPSRLYLTLFIGSSQSNMLSPIWSFYFKFNRHLSKWTFFFWLFLLFPRFPEYMESKYLDYAVNV